MKFPIQSGRAAVGSPPQRPASASLPGLRALLASVLACAVLGLLQLSGCGGGVGSGGTGTYASGAITGFGSVIVNDVRFDDSVAVVTDDDDGARSSGELKLGMTVTVQGDSIRDDGTGRAATASSIRFGSELLGPASAVNAAAGTLTVLGQAVVVGVETVFDERLVGGLSGVAAGQVLEVYALYDAARAAYLATRIEPRSADGSGTTLWRVRGPVVALDTAAKTLRMGAANFNYAAATAVPPDLAVGRVLRLSVLPLADAGGRYTVAGFSAGVRLPDDRPQAEVKGLVTAFSSALNFAVNGISVDATSAAFPDGVAGLRLGARVEVQGASVSGVIQASRVELESDDEVRERGFEFRGSIDSVDLAARTFKLRGETISWARADLRLEDGTLADLTVGRRVEVKAQPTADRTRLEATRIKFE